MKKLSCSYLVGLGLIVLLVTPSAHADDWSGPYAGLMMGYGAGRDTQEEINGPRIFHTDTDGFTGGVLLGWQRQYRSFVGGVEAEVGHLGQSGEITKESPGVIVRNTVDFTGYGTIAARLGYAVRSDWLLYGRAGGGVAAIDVTTEESLTPSSAKTRDYSFAWLAGGGIEHAFSDKWRGRIEYEYFRFADELALPAVGPGWEHSLDIHRVKVGVSYRF